jgi:glycosyltransferase involved in cell wall biosynthesis
MSEQNKKIVWILCSNRWNSAITEYALSSAQSLRKLGHKVIFSPLAGTLAETRANSYGLDTRSFAKFGLPAVFKFRKILRESQPDALFTFGGPETFLTKFRLGAKPKVYRFRGQDEDAKSESAKPLTALSVSHCAGIIVPCEFIVSNMEKLTKKPVHNITLGCDPQVFKRFETMGAYLKKRPEIMLLGRLDPIKGHKRMMQIMRLVLDQWQDPQRKPRLHIIGQPANLSEADLNEYAKAAKLELEEDVMISARRVSPIAKYLSEAVLGVVPSTGSEIICRVAEEFLLCGTPVIVSGVGSLEEVLFENAGESFKDLSDKEAADIIIKWIKKSMSEGELEKRKRATEAKKLFSYEEMGKELEALL